MQLQAIHKHIYSHEFAISKIGIRSCLNVIYKYDIEVYNNSIELVSGCNLSEKWRYSWFVHE